MNLSRTYNVLLRPLISEKSMVAQSLGQYTFQVQLDATKKEVRAAVETLFKVNVEAIRMVRIAGKLKRFGRMEGRRQSIKKAIVKLQPGQTIDIFTQAEA